MQYNRLTSDTALLDLLKNIQRDIKKQQTQGSGTIIVTDEVTGVETILGELPDGTVGFKPFVNDTTPPPVPTAPAVSAEPGTFVVVWDGTFAAAAPKPNDFVKCNIFGHKIVAGTTVATLAVGQATTALDVTHISTDIANIGETWQFSLESEDYNGNKSALSLRSAEVVMVDFPANQAVNDAIDDLSAEVLLVQQAASDAQTVAADAAQEAADATAAALAASNLAGTKGKVLFQTTAPTGADANTSTLWIDTTAGANTPKKWVSGVTWTAVTDKAAIDAASAAATAQTKADQAFNNAATAATAAGTAQATADLKNRVWYQTTPPAGTGHKNGDQWFDTDDGNRIYLWNSTTNLWTNFQDAAIAAAQTSATTALTAANGKNKLYFQDNMPSGGTYILGDTWFDTNDGNKIYNYNGSTFVAAQLGTNAIASLAITNALIANLDAAKITTGFIDALRIAADSITADKLFVGDLTNLAADGSFLDLTKANWSAPATSTVLTSTSEPNKLKIITAASGNNDTTNLNEFQVTPGETIYAEAMVYGETANVGAGTANLILTVTDTAGVKTFPVFGNKNRAAASGIWSKISGVVTIPAGAKTANLRLNVTFSADAIGNIWYFRDVIARRQVGGTYISTGGITTNHMTAGTIDAAVLTAGSIKSPMIAAKTITTDRMVISSTDNLAVEADFSGAGASWELNTNRTIIANANRSATGPVLRITGVTAEQVITNLANKFTVDLDSRFRAMIVVKSTAALTTNAIKVQLRCYTSATASTLQTIATSAPLIAGTWMQVTGISSALPAGTITAEVVISVTNNATGTVTDIDYIAVTRASDGNLIVDGSISATKLAADSVTADKIAAKSIATDKLIIGGGTNLHPDPGFIDVSTTGWPVASADVSYGTGTGFSGSKTLNILSGTGAKTFYYAQTTTSKKVDIVPGAQYHLSAWFKSSTAIPIGKIALQFLIYKADGTNTLATAVNVLETNNPTLIPANTWVKVKKVVLIQAGDYVKGVFGIWRNSDHLADILMSDPYLERAVDGSLVVDGTVTATKLVASDIWADSAWLGIAGASSLKLTSTAAPISGVDPDGNPINTITSSEVNSQGLRVINTITDFDNIEVDSQEVIKLGTFDEDFFAISKAGIPKVTMNSEGNITATSLDVDSLTVSGENFATSTDSRPRGMAAWGQVPINTNMSVSGGEVGLFEIGFSSDDDPPRMYQFNLNPFLIDCSTAGTYGLRVRYTTDGSVPTITNSTILGYNYFRTSASGLASTAEFTRIIGSNNGNYLRILVCLYATGGNCNVYSGTGQTHLYSTVMDLGESREATGNATTGGGTPFTGTTVAAPAIPKVTKTTEWGFSGVRSYTGTNATYAYNTGKGYQGLSPAGYGNLKSIYVFPNTITSTISGSTINGVWLYGYFEHWYVAAGGTARFRLHANTSLPATYNGTGFGMNSGAWPRASGRWVAVPSSLWAGFLSGAYKGFGFEGDSTFNTYGIANNARIRIKYTK